MVWPPSADWPAVLALLTLLLVFVLIAGPLLAAAVASLLSEVNSIQTNGGLAHYLQTITGSLRLKTHKEHLISTSPHPLPLASPLSVAWFPLLRYEVIEQECCPEQ